MNALSGISEDRRAGLGSAQVSAELPAGADARSSPEFESLDGEIRKLDTAGPNAVDWKKVATAGLAIIEHQSKDILVGAWVAFALFRTEGLGGLSVGLSVLQGMVADHWEGAVPPARRERARVAAFDWLTGRLAPGLAEGRYDDAAAVHLVSIQDALDRIDETMSSKLQKESLSLGEIVRAIRPHADQAKRVLAEAAQRLDEQAQRVAAEAKAATSTPAVAPEPASGAAPAVSPPSTPAAAANVPAPAVGDIDGLAVILWTQAQALRSQDIGDPKSYMLGRTASWLRFDAVPADQGGKTFVTAPAELEALERAAAENQIEAALLAAEALVWSAPFCLDAHRHAYELLGKLDRGYDAARATVLGMLGYFARRFDGVTELAFNDGRPFADEATRGLIASAGGAGGTSAPADAMTTAVGQARGLLASGKAYEAMDLLAQTLRRASSGRQRAQWQVVQAQFCIDQGYVAAALPLLDHLDRIVQDRDLETWEPDLACLVTESQMRALVHPDTQMTLVEDRRRDAVESARGRLARLDIGATVRLLRP